jgi:hypothetical protein
LKLSNWLSAALGNKYDPLLERQLDRHWLRWTLIAWVVVLIWLLWQRWLYVQGLALGDTDDNMRLMQVRGLLAGQGWYDLTQYRLNPPEGYNIHWSRLVDLPIAGLILFFKLFVSTPQAERLACGIAPILPLGLSMASIAFTTRQLVARLAWPFGVVILLCCATTMLMYMPERIDHHGWQLACLAATVAGIADPKRARGGAIVGAASAASLTIGLEMLPYCVMAAGITALRWIWDRGEARRLMALGAALAGGCALGYAGFGSYANTVLRCDALTPVWLSVMIEAGGALFALAWWNPQQRWLRFAVAAVAGAAILGAFAHLFPQCLGRPEQVSDELYDTWLSNVREAKPIYRHAWKTAVPVAVLPVIGIIGGVFATWRARGRDNLVGWIAVTLFGSFAAAMLLWQMRAGPAAQLLAVPGAAALAWTLLPWCLGHRLMVVRVFGTVGAALAVSGLFAGLIVQYIPDPTPQNKVTRVVNNASGRCATVASLRPLNLLPPAVIFTHVDLGPRLITVTHHYAIAGPYHRNGDAILDVHHAFTGPAAGFLPIAGKHHARYLLTCPNIAESTIYRSRNPNGFYGQLSRGTIFPWLEPITMPKGSPLKLWRIRYPAASAAPPTPPAAHPAA